MSYWWVNHNQTHTLEIEGGYIWSPKTNSNGAKNQTYINLTLVKPGDVVFSYAKSHIKAIGVVSMPCINEKKPLEFGNKGANWETDGWLVHIEWLLLKKEFSPKKHISKLSPLLPEKNSPIQKSGNGNQGCYLASISKALHDALMSLSEEAGNEVDFEDITLDLENTLEEEKIIHSDIQETEKKQLTKARIGQGLFKARVEQVEPRCRITGVSNKKFLVASHIKPWCKSSNMERLDGNNGLLLSPHVDKLFDRGWITFSNEGEILCSSKKVKDIMCYWNLDVNENVGSFTNQQKVYLSYHRDNIYKGSHSPASLKNTAELSKCRKYRYALWRTWDDSKPHVLFVCLNPSTADEETNDQTLKRCIGFAKSWEKYGGVCMANLFAFRARHRSDMKAAAEPIGSQNDEWLKKLSSEAALVVAAWGEDGSYLGRSKEVMRLLSNVHCLTMLDGGEPGHPLYLPGNLKPVPMNI